MFVINCDVVGEIVDIEVIGVDFNGNISSCVVVVEVVGMFCGFIEMGIDCEDGIFVIYDLEVELFIFIVEDCIGYLNGEVFFVGIILCDDGEIVVYVDVINLNVRVGVVMRESSDLGVWFVSIIKDLG